MNEESQNRIKEQLDPKPNQTENEQRIREIDLGTLKPQKLGKIARTKILLKQTRKNNRKKWN